MDRLSTHTLSFQPHIQRGQLFPNPPQVSNVRFGWTTDTLKQDPSRFTLNLELEDIVWTKDTSPSRLQGEEKLTGHWQQWVPQDPAAQKENEKKVPRLKEEKLEKILKTLVRDNVEQPGFMVINNLEKIFQTPQSMALFFKWLMIDLGYIINNNPKYRAYYEMDSGEGNMQVTLSGLKYMRDGKQRDYPRYTHKVPHFDKGPAINGLLYFQPVWGVEGGVPQVYDIEDYAKAHPGLTYTRKVDRGMVPSDYGKEEIHPEILKDRDFQDNYTLTLDSQYPNKPTLVLVNNKGHRRVAHGTTPLFISNPNNPDSFDRTFLRYGLHLGKGVYTKTEDHPQWAIDFPPKSKNPISALLKKFITGRERS